jgi:DNA-directed RNA polymerase subunit RPC12/RpoP
MPTCNNCGSHVSDQYLKVFEPESVDDPKACPRCEDKIRSGAEVRDIRAPRQ